LPILKKLNVKWLILQSPLNHAIPEAFVNTVSQEKINLVVDFAAPLKEERNWNDIELLLSGYGKWGVKYALLDRFPNLQSSWKTIDWLNPAIVEQHVQEFIRFAEICLDSNIRPVFSPLYPGGDYLDLAFFSEAMRILQEKSSLRIRRNFLAAAIAWHGKSLTEIQGNGEKELGEIESNKLLGKKASSNTFRNFVDYIQIASKQLEICPPFFLLECGRQVKNETPASYSEAEEITNRRHIYKLLKNENTYNLQDNRIIDPIQSQIIAGFFSQLSSETDSNNLNWFDHNKNPSIFAQSVFSDILLGQDWHEIQTEIDGLSDDRKFKFDRYILLHERYKSIADDFIRRLNPYLERYKPIVGFSKEDASNSAYVIYLHPEKDIPKEDLNWIHSRGNLIKTVQPKDIGALVME